MSPSAARASAVMLAILGLTGCRRSEPPEAARARAQGQYLERQIVGLEALIEKAEGGNLVTLDQIAIGIEESVAKDLLGAPLPREVVVEKRLRIRLESVEPYFRGNEAALLFRAQARLEDAPSFSASIELAGSLDDFKLEAGHLTSRVKLRHFALLGSSVGVFGPVAERLIRDNLNAIEASIPPVEIPVRLEPEVRIEAARMGPVTVKPGELPLHIEVSQVLPVGGRLWILLSAHAGPWKAASGGTGS